MDITTHRRCRGAERVEQRIREITDQAGQIVTGKLGGRIPHVEDTLTDRRGVVSLTQQAEVALAGGTLRGGLLAERVTTHLRWRPLASTSLIPGGALVAIDVSRARDLRELDRTVIHELAHCVQLATPGAREQHVSYLRQQHGLIPRSRDDVRAYERLMDIHEQQAENLEILAQQLPVPKGQ